MRPPPHAGIRGPGTRRLRSGRALRRCVLANFSSEPPRIRESAAAILTTTFVARPTSAEPGSEQAFVDHSSNASAAAAAAAASGRHYSHKVGRCLSPAAASGSLYTSKNGPCPGPSAVSGPESSRRCFERQAGRARRPVEVEQGSDCSAHARRAHAFSVQACAPQASCVQAGR
jgi:hypothetical protein